VNSMLDLFVEIEGLIALVVALLTVISTFGGIYLRRKWVDNSRQKDLEQVSYKNGEVIKVLKSLLFDFGADRAYVFEFHNGDYFLSGMPIRKFTCTYEVVSDGVSAECHNPGEYRISNYNEYISSIIHERDYLVECVEEMDTDALLKSLLTKKGVKSLYNVPIRTYSGKTVGFIGLDFVKSKKVLNDKEINTLRSAAKLVTGYIAQ
jgi:hypothetical protein